MDKHPLYSIDTLFQEKLEELPVDTSLQQEQWLSLSKTMSQQPTGFRSQLQKPMAKLLYMTVVAIVPFTIYYFSNQPATESEALHYSSNSVTKSLLVLNKAGRPIVSSKPSIQRQAVAAPSKKEVAVAVPPSVSNREPIPKAVSTIAEKDTIRTAPVKQEKPVVKKADSSYIYWQ